MLRAYWNWVSDIGISPGLPLIEQKRVRLINQICAVFIVVETLVSLYSFFHWSLMAIYVYVILIAAIFLLVLQYNGQFTAARTFMSLFFPVMALSYLLLFGDGYGIEYNYFGLTICSFYLFSALKVRLFFVLYNLMIYLFGRYYIEVYSSVFDLPLDLFGRDISFFFALAITFLLVQIFAKENEAYEIKMERLYGKLQEKNRALKSAYTELERFTYIASHDLKTPLRTIVSFLGLIERDLENGKSKNLKEYLDFAKTGAKQMHFLVSDILEFSRLEQNAKTEITTVDLSSLIEDIEAQSLSLVEEKQVTIQYDKLPSIRASKTQIQLLFQNLIENGIKYNNRENILIKIEADQLEKGVIFRIKDNGIGIAQEYHLQIFEMFKRLHTDEKYQGTGIGLAICKKIVEKLGGKIWLESEENVGSTFFVFFPIHQEEEALIV